MTAYEVNPPPFDPSLFHVVPTHRMIVEDHRPDVPRMVIGGPGERDIPVEEFAARSAAGRFWFVYRRSLSVAAVLGVLIAVCAAFLVRRSLRTGQ